MQRTLKLVWRIVSGVSELTPPEQITKWESVLSTGLEWLDKLTICIPGPQGDIPLRQVVIPLRQGDIPLRQLVIPLRQDDIPLRQGDIPLRQIDISLRQGDIPFRQVDIHLRQGRYSS